MPRFRTMRDLSAFPLEFVEPLPAALQVCLSYPECYRLHCVTTTAALKEWIHWRMHGAGFKSDRSFATKFLTAMNKCAERLFQDCPDCYLAVFFASDDKQEGRLVVHLVKVVTDERGVVDVDFPAPYYFSFTEDKHWSESARWGGFDSSLPYLIYAEYEDQKGLLEQA